MIAFTEDKFTEVVNALRKGGYVITDCVGPCLGIYPIEECDQSQEPKVHFIPLGGDLPTDYPLRGVPHPRVLSTDYSTGELRIGFKGVSMNCAWIDFEKNELEFDLEGIPATRIHHDRIRKIMSPFASDSSAKASSP